MATIGDLVVNLGLNRKGYGDGLKSARNQTTSFVSGLRSVIAPVAGILGGVAAGFAATKSINAAREQIKEEQKLAAVLKATGGAAGLTAKQIQSYAADLQKVTNFGDEATIGAAGMLATFKNIRGDQFKETLASAQDLSAVMGTDLKSSILQLGKALNDPAQGLSALTRSGVSFSDEQRRMIRNLQESGDLMGAQRIILQELQGQFGGSAQAMADPLIQAKNLVGDLGELLGFALVPGLQEMVSGFMGAAGPLGENRALFESLGESIRSVVSVMMGPLVNGFTTMVEYAQQTIELVAFAFENGFQHVGALVDLAMIDVSLAIYRLVPGVADVLQEVAGFFVATWDATAAATTAFVDNVIAGLTEIRNIGEAVVAAIAQAFDALVSGENPLEAFTAGFAETLANQENVAGGGNPLQAFADTFRDTQANIRLGFDESSLVDSLQAERDRIASTLGLKDFAAGLKPPGIEDAAAIAATGEDAAGLAANQGQSKGASALQFGSREAASAILKAQLGGGGPKELKRIEQESKKQTQQNEQMLQVMRDVASAATGKPLVLGFTG